MTQNVNDTHAESLSTTEWIASFITNKVGTFGCFVFFTVLACISLPAVVEAHSVILWIQWITQSFLQLVLLPLIMIGQNLQSRHSELKADGDFAVNLKSEHEIEEIHRKLDILLGGEVRIK